MKELTIQNLNINLNEVNTFYCTDSFDVSLFCLEVKNKYGGSLANSIYIYKGKAVSSILACSLKTDKLVKKFNLTKLVDKNYDDLSCQEKALVVIVNYLVAENKFLIINDLFYYLNEKEKTKIVHYIKENNMTLLNITSNTEDALLSDYILVGDNTKIVLNFPLNEILDNERDMRLYGIGLPFMTDLSYKLRLYELIDTDYLDMKKLVGALWKQSLIMFVLMNLLILI